MYATIINNTRELHTSYTGLNVHRYSWAQEVRGAAQEEDTQAVPASSFLASNGDTGSRSQYLGWQ